MLLISITFQLTDLIQTYKIINGIDEVDIDMGTGRNPERVGEI